MTKESIITVRFADDFTGKIISGIEMNFECNPLIMMRGEIRKWIEYIKPFIDNSYRRRDKLHGKLITKITYNYNL